MRRQLVRHKSLPALNIAELSSDSTDKTLQNGSAVPDPAHIKPFEHGFMREVVLRAVQEAGGKQQSDVYYHTPEGQKLRSRREVADYLGRNRKLPLGQDNFTFSRIAIYHPPQEVVRQALRRWNRDPAPASLSGAPVPKAASTSSSASARIRSTSEEAAAATASPCANRDGVLSVRRSTRKHKQCLCCRESLGGRKRRGTESSNAAAATSQAKRPRKSMAATSQRPAPPTKAPQTMRARNLGGKPPGASPPPKAQRKSRPTTPRGPGRPPKRRAQSLGRPAVDSPRSASGGRRPGATREAERRLPPRRSLPGSPVSHFDDNEEESEESSEDGDGEGPLETSPKRAFVLLQDVLRTETGPGSSSELNGDAAPPPSSSSSENSGSVVPIALKAHVQPWQSSVSWEIYKLLKERNSGGTGAADNEEGETSVVEPGSDRVRARSARRGKTGFEDEEGCATDWLRGPTILEDSTDALEVVLEDADAGSSAAALEKSPTRSPATPRRPRQRTPALAAKRSLTNTGAPAPVCSINCPQALGQTPQLHCTRCLCLFHPVCVGLLDIHPHVTRGSFICKPCGKVSYHRAGKGSAKSSTQPALADNALPNETPRAASGARPLQAKSPSTALVASTVAFTAAPSTPRPSFVTSPGAVLPGPSSVSLPMVHLMAARPLPPLQFVCSPTESPSAGPLRLLPPTLSVGGAVAAASSPPVRVNAQPPRCMPTLVAAPRPPNPAKTMTVVQFRPAAMPALQPQPAGVPPDRPPPDRPPYYSVQLKQRLDSSAMAAVVHLVRQAAHLGTAELQMVCSRYGMALQVGKTTDPAAAVLQLLQPTGPASPVPLPAAGSSQAVVATQLASPPVLQQPVSGNGGKKWASPPGQPSVLKRTCVLTESSSTAPSGECVPSSAALPQPVPAQKPESGNVPPQPAVTPSVRGEVAIVVPKAEPKMDKTAPLGSRHRAILPKQPCGMQAAVSGNEPSNTSSITPSEAKGVVGVVRAVVTLAPQGTTPAAGIPTSPGEHMEAAAAAEEKESSIATFCKIENVVSMAAAAEAEWPLASDGSEGEGRLVIVEGNEVTEGTANHADENPSSCKKENEKKAEKPSDRSLPKGEGAWQPSVPHTPPTSESSHSAEAGESSASEQGPNDSIATPPNGIDAQGSRKAARMKRVKRRKPQGGASPLNSSPIWVRSQRELVFVTDRSSTVDPLALHRDVVPNSARVFSDLASAMMALNQVFSWLSLPSLCSAAQVCKAWSIAANSPFLWKRIDFRQFRVQNWDTCVTKLRSRCPEELILDGESLDHLLPYAEQFSMVERVSLVVNARQLACVARAFPALRSLRAVVVRKSSAAAAEGATASQNGGGGEGEAGGQDSAPGPPPQRQASLGCLTELLCIKGLERLELSGAHGLALLPLTMTATSLAQRCQQLRMLSLTTVQVLTPVVVFPISLLEQLEELHLGNCTNWSNASFVNLCQLRDLRRLTLELGEDGPGFHTMLLKLSKLEKLELKRWTLRDSLANVLPRMTRLRSFVLWPQTSSAALKSHRNALRSCLSAGDGLERLTWIVSCKPLLVRGGGTGMNKAMSTSLMHHLAPDLRISFEGGALCRCQAGANSVLVSSASSNSKAAEAAACASPNTKSHKSAPDVVDAGNASANGPATSSTANNATSPRKSGATPKLPSPEAPCCPLAKKISEVWNTSSDEPWHLTLRQFRDGLQHCMAPQTAVCVCVHVEL